MALTGKPQLTTKALLINDGFWPDLVISELMDKYRIPPEFADDTVRVGLNLAMINVNRALQAVQDFIVDLMHVSLLDYCVNNEQLIGGEHVLITQYKHAVFCRAKAFLLQQFNSMNRRAVAENAAKEAPETEQYWLDQSQAAIHYFYEKFLPLVPVSAQSGTYVTLL